MNDLELEETRERLSYLPMGWKYMFFGSVESTNGKALELVSEGSREGIVVAAGTQTGGRGRLHRVWHSPPGGLWFSFLLKPAHADGLLSLIAGIAVSNAVERCGVSASVKWPNDVLVGEKKVAGILLEGVDKRVVIGVGINANITLDHLPEELRDTATTLLEEVGEVNRGELLEHVLEDFGLMYGMYTNDEREELLEMWRKKSSTLGKHVKVETVSGTVEGTALDIDDGGGLIVYVGGGEHKLITSGDCKHLRS